MHQRTNFIRIHSSNENFDRVIEHFHGEHPVEQVQFLPLPILRFSDENAQKITLQYNQVVGENTSPQKNKTPFIYVKCNTKEIIFLRSHSNMFQIKSSRGFPRELHRYSYLIYLIAVTKYKCSTLQ